MARTAFAAATPTTSPSDDQFLDDLQHRAFRFFWEQADPTTGLIADRARADGRSRTSVASIASVGFGLTAICIADRRGWIEREQAYQRVLTTLRYFARQMPQEHGFFCHFIDMRTGRREWNCEYSSIDTAILAAGVMTARQQYRGTPADPLAGEIFDRIDWPWMLAGGQTLSMGWKPESGFLAARWDNFSEHPFMYIMALGSRSHPLPSECWRAWRREPVVSYAGRSFMQCPPLFTHQYPHAWVDFRGRSDDYANYWQNSVNAIEAHRQFCIDLAKRFPHYGPNVWGITASDGREGYRAWGGPPGTADIDGTVVPCAAGGSIPFAPRASIDALRHMHRTYGQQIWKKYGFVDAFNPATGWIDTDVIGIDLGMMLLMAENHRTGAVWDLFMRNPEAQRGMTAAGLRKTPPVKR